MPSAITRLRRDPRIHDLARLPQLEAWYSAKDPTDIKVATGVQLWRDRSGKSNETLLACDRLTGAAASNIASLSTTDLTVAAWVNTESFAAAQYIIGGAADAFALYIHTDGKLTAKKQGAAALTAATTALTAGKLAHVAYVRSGANSEYYINGAAAGTAADAANDYATACTLIGSTTNATTTPLGGTLQRPAIFNRALSAAEILALSTAGGAPASADYYGAGIGTAINAGSFVIGKRYRIASAGSTDFTLIGAANSSVGTEFVATGAGTGTGTATAIGLLAYWDFSTATRGAATVTDTSGNSCVLTASTGARISGARDLYQGTAANQPVYDAATQSITTDGSNDYLKTAPFALVQPEWLVVVGRYVTNTNGDNLWDGNSAGAMLAQTTLPSGKLYITAGIAGPNITLVDGVTVICTFVYNGTSSSVQKNRDAPATGNVGAGNANGFTLGAWATGSGPENLRINELAIFSRAPSAAEIDRVVRYMARRWSIAI